MHLQKEDELTRKIFKHAVVVRDVLAEDHSHSRKALAAAAKKKVKVR